MAGKNDGFCGHPENAEALRKVLNKKPLDEALADLGVTVSICEDCMHGVARCECDEKLAALRRRLLDIQAGAFEGPTTCSTTYQWASMWRRFVNSVEHVFDTMLPSDLRNPDATIDSLAAWLWERGVRA